MLNSLKNRSREDIERVFASLAQRLLPQPQDELPEVEAEGLKELQDSVLAEIRANLNLDPADQTQTAKTKIIEFLIKEMSEPVVSGDRGEQARARLKQRGDLLSVFIEEKVTVSDTVRAEVITYPQALLTFARKLIDDDQFSIAVVVSHMACEIAAERSVSESFVKKGIQYLEDPVINLLNGYNFANDKTRELYTALTGDEIQKQPFWQKFKESGTRRNHIIHWGRVVRKAEAEDSFKAASDFVAHLKKEGIAPR
jgi:hypothetical protein